MKRKNNNVIYILLLIVFAIICYWISYKWFDAIFYSDMPAWLKWILLSN